MALLTAEDVLNKAFQKTRYREGFDQDEVDEFLDEVADTIAALTAERDELQRRLAAGGGAPVTGATPQAVPSGSLIAAATDPNPPSATTMLAMAQKLHDDYVQAGEAEREKIMDDARAKAEDIVRQAEKDAQERLGSLEAERAELERSIDDLRRFERDYRGHLRNYLENLLGDLEHSASKGAAAPVTQASASFGAAQVAEPAPVSDAHPIADAAPAADAHPIADTAPIADAAPVSDAYPTAVSPSVETFPASGATPVAEEAPFAASAQPASDPEAAAEPQQATYRSGSFAPFPQAAAPAAFPEPVQGGGDTQAFDEFSGLAPSAPVAPAQPAFPEPVQSFAPVTDANAYGQPVQPATDGSGAIAQPPAEAPQEGEADEMPRWNF